MGCGRPAAHKKKASRLGAFIVFIDRTGLMLLPIVQRSWAPIGPGAPGSISPRRRRLNLYLHMYVAGDITAGEVIVFGA